MEQKYFFSAFSDISKITRIQQNAIQMYWQYWSHITAPTHHRPNIKDKVINDILLSVWVLTYSKINGLLKPQRMHFVLMFMPETKTNRTEILVTYSDSQYYSHKNKQTLWNTIFLEQLTVTSWPIIPHISWNTNFHTSWSHPSPWIRMLQQVLLEPPTQRLPGFLPLRQVGWGVKLTTYHHLVMRLTNELYSYSYFLPSCCAQEQMWLYSAQSTYIWLT